METSRKQRPEDIPTFAEQGSNVYRPEDIKRWGVERFLDKVASNEPFHFDIKFSEEENRRMDDLLAEEKGR
jgi:hypothetical protein